MENREFPLDGVNIESVFNFGEGEGGLCKIIRIYQDGLDVRFSDQRYLQGLSGQITELESIGTITFKLESRYIAIDCLVVECRQTELKLRLLKSDPSQLTALCSAYDAAKSSAQKAAPVDQGQNRLAAAKRSNLIKITNTRNRSFLEDHLPDFFKALQETLFTEAEKQGDNTSQQRFFEALSAFKKQSGRIASQLEGTLAADASDVANGRWKEKDEYGVGQKDDNSLSLVDKNEFEDWLIVRVATSRTELQFREVLIELQLRFDVAFGQESGARVYNPYGPAAFCNAFYNCIRPLRLSQKIERLVFKVFQERVLSNLGILFKTINSILIDADILPDINVSKYLASEALKNRPSTDTKKPATAEIPSQDKNAVLAPDQQALAADPIAAIDNANEPANQSFNRIQQGLERARTAYSTATQLWQLNSRSQGDVGVAGAAEMTGDVVREYSNAIEMVKNQILNGAINLDSPGALKHHLAQFSGPNSAVKEQHYESADMIENLFSNILEDTRIDVSLRSELRKLEVPILEVLLNDPSIFTADFHPARQAVNYIAMLSDKGSVNLNQNRPLIRQTIEEIVKVGNTDPETFVNIVSQLDTLVNKEKALIERNLSRVTEACIGQQKVKGANQLIERELAKRLANRSVPEVLIQLVDEGWRELMRLCYFREGIDSRSWEMTLIVIDQLLLRLVPDNYDESKILLKADELLKLVEKGLSKVGSKTAAQDKLLKELGSLLVMGLDENTPFGQYQGLIENQDSQSSRLQQLGVSDEDKTVQRWIKRTRNLKEGQWLEFDANSENPLLHQLAWISDQFDRYVFVNHQGMKVKDLSLEELALSLKTGDVIVLSESGMSAVDKGLDALIRKIYDQLAFESAHDQLTGLRTRKEFERCLAQVVGRSKRNETTYALIFVDILQFKVINNTCGYEAGDAFLKEIANRISSVVYEGAMIGRIGGNEFGIIIQVDDEKDGYLIATEVKSAIEEKRFVSNDQSFVISAVVSMISFDHYNNHVLELLRSVEAASEIGKKSGHSEIQVVTPGDARMEERDEVMSWVARINRALDEGNLKMRCQLIQPIEGDKHFPHFEVLLTVVDKNGEHLPPADFIKAAEEYHRMAAVDRWVINSVLMWMKNHESLLKNMGGFSINLSGHSLNDETFLDFLFEALVRYGVPRNKLIFEITETTAVANLEDAADFINEMKGIGCRFSLDDFGAGQSSYTYLKRLPVDFIKIDGAFIRNITSDDVDYAMVKSITEMGHFLDKKIIAEFVSSEEIMEVVRDLGVDYAQGYYFGKPVMLEDVDSYLKEQNMVA